MSSNSKIAQVCNISTACQKEQLRSLFNYIGKIRDICLYPESETITSTLNSKVGYIKFDRSDHVHAALAMTNTIFMDRPLVVSQVLEDDMPTEVDAMIYCTPLDRNITLLSGGPSWSSKVIHRLIGQTPNAFFETIDPELTERNLPSYPMMPGTIGSVKVEEIRRTVYLTNINKEVTLEVLHKFLSQVGEIRYIRFAYTDENAETHNAYVEFSEQTSIPRVLSINGFDFFSRPIYVNHATTCIVKPAVIQDQKAVNENKNSNRSRSRSKSHRRRTDSDDDDDDRDSSPRSRRKSKYRSRSRKRSRSYERRRSRSYERHRRKKRSPSKDRRSLKEKKSRK